MFINPDNYRSGKAARRSGFTLLEVIVAMAVFSVVAVSVFEVMNATLVSSAELQASERINRETTALVELLRKSFSTLPAAATLRSDPSEATDPDGPDLVIGNAPSCFAWDERGLNYGTATMGIRGQENGLYSIALSRSDFFASEEEAAQGIGETTSMEPDDQGRYWLPLVTDLQWVQWRFFDSKLDDWTDTWTQRVRPRLVELQFCLPEDTIPVRAVFTVSTSTEPPTIR